MRHCVFTYIEVQLYIRLCFKKKMKYTLLIELINLSFVIYVVYFLIQLYFSRYTPAARLSEVVYDSTLVTFTYDEASGTVKTIHLTHNGFISSIRYRQTGTYTQTLRAHAVKGVRATNLKYLQCAMSHLYNLKGSI